MSKEEKQEIKKAIDFLINQHSYFYESKIENEQLILKNLDTNEQFEITIKQIKGSEK